MHEHCPGYREGKHAVCHHAGCFIFVFGSNRLGIHGGGAARDALVQYGAVWGNGEGLQGQSYAIPTKQTPTTSLRVEEVEEHVGIFLACARRNPNLRFKVTRIGCGLAGFTEEQIGPMFRGAPSNVTFFDEGWERYR